MEKRSGLAHAIVRVIGRHEQHRTRFHTARGRLMPPGAWLALPGLLIQRSRDRGDSSPWMVAGAVSRLDKLIQPSWHVLEFGAGYSTRWYAQRAAHVTSLESDELWYQRLAVELAGAGFDNVSLKHAAGQEMIEHVQRFEQESLDLVIIDCDSADRVECAAAAAPRVRPGGILLLDDSDRGEWRETDTVLAGWHVERFTGVKPFPLVATETSLYFRPVW